MGAIVRIVVSGVSNKQSHQRHQGFRRAGQANVVMNAMLTAWT